MGTDIPAWCEGEVLPPFLLDMNRHDRTTFAMNPMDNFPHSKITEGIYSIFRGNYKLMYYFDLKEMKMKGRV